LFEGSVSQYVARHADRPVLTVPHLSELHSDQERRPTPPHLSTLTTPITW
jgi:hypothetical protein